MPTIILASTSPYRKALLERLGLPFTAEKPICDEDAYKTRGLTPQVLAETLAEAKAVSVAAAHPDAIVIGSDQVAEVDGQILGKPGTRDRAIAQVQWLNGREHRLITALAVVHGREIRRHTDITTLVMRSLDQAAIARYIDADRPLDCAASYKLECRGIVLFSRIDSRDHSAITGLPLIALVEILTGFGVAVP